VNIPLDPRTRLGLALVCAVLIIASPDPLWLAAELASLLVIVLVAGQGRAYLEWLPLVAFTAVTWFIISLLAFDLIVALTASLRLTALASVFFLLFRLTPAEDLANALVKAGLPYEVAFVVVASLQFVPVIRRKAQNVFDAQRARGIAVEPGLAAFWPQGEDRTPPVLALVAPLLVQSFRLADELAEGMEARGFGRPGRTFMREYRLRALDWLVLLAAAVLLAVLLCIR